MLDAPPLEMELDEDRIRRRRALLRFDEDDAHRLTSLAPLILPHIDEFTDGFFDYLADFSEADGLLDDAAAVREARRLKCDHLRAMVEGSYGLEYAQQRVRLAAVYSRAGLDHQAFLGAFNHLMSQISARVEEQFGGNAKEVVPTLETLRKLALFDIGLILDALTFDRQRLMMAQQAAIHALSTPVLKLRDRLLLLPLIGIVDPQRTGQLTEQLLQAIRENRAKVVVLDITGAASVDTAAANDLVQTISKARVMGSEVIVTGVSAEMAQRLVQIGVDLERMSTVGDLQGGIERAERLLASSQPSAARLEPRDAPVDQAPPPHRRNGAH